MSAAMRPCQDEAPSMIYGRQTTLALENFPGGNRSVGNMTDFVRSYAMVKIAACRANADLGVIDRDRAAAIEAAAREIIDGTHASQFPLPLVQGGGGTSTNMNFNEVIATRASQILREEGIDALVHPNDHVNASQSTNDTYPTAMALALLFMSAPTYEALSDLRAAFLAKAEEFDGQVRLGRTCLQDAVPLTVGQTHRAQAEAITRVLDQLKESIAGLASVSLGGTAVGTGLGAPEGYSQLAVDYLSEVSGQQLALSPDFFDSMAHLDPYSAVGSACARAAMVLAKISADFRLLSSGPRGGLGELALPALQKGSSIMPGKVNPVIPELVMQLSFRIRGAAATVDLAVAAGELELNVMEPVILDALSSALKDLTDAARSLGDKCVAGMTWNSDALQRNLAGSRDLDVRVAAEAGYDRATAVERERHQASHEMP